MTHVTISRWWCPFTSAYYPAVRIRPNWESIAQEVDCTTATDADVVEHCKEERIKRAEEEARAAEAEAARAKAEDEAAKAQVEEQEAQAQAAAQLRATEEAKAEEQLRYQEKIAEQVKREQTLGYKPIDFENVVLDKSSLIAARAKVAIRGFYTKIGESELLVKTVEDTTTPSEDDLLALLTDNATRDMRKYFLTCRSTTAECPVTLLGQITECTSNNLFGVQHYLICLSVDDGWNVPQPE